MLEEGEIGEEGGGGGESGRIAITKPGMRPSSSRKETHKGVKNWLEQHLLSNTLTESEKAAFDILSEVDDWWSYEAEKQRDSSDTNSLTKTLTEMQKSISRLEEKIEKKPSYATVARPSGRNNAAHGTPNNNAARELKEQRKLKSIIVRVVDPKERANVRLEHTKDLLNKVGMAIGGNNKPVGVRRLPSGDLEFQMTSLRDKQTAEAEPNWTKVIAGSTQIQRRKYTVMVHGVRMSNIDTSNQQQAIQKILAQNTRLHNNLTISKVSWFQKAMQEKKIFSSLLIETTTPNSANELIKQGMIEDYEVKTCVLFDNSNRLLQCVKCYEYGHFARNCKNVTCCGHCAGAHGTEECNEESTKCAVCHLEGHEAWSPTCKKRQEQKARMKITDTERQTLYVEEETPHNSTDIGVDRGRKRDRSGHSTDSSSQNSQNIETPRDQTPQGVQAAAWQSTFQGKARGPPAKRAYTQVKIRQKRSVIEDIEL